MRILSLDLGRSKSVACDYVAETAEHAFESLSTDPGSLHDLLVKRQADVVVIEICPAAGWIKDLCDALGQKLVVASTSDEPWRWRKLKSKSDRQDALKVAKLLAMQQIAPVHIPAKAVRQWRSLIHYRQTLVGDATAIRNRIRGLLDPVALKLPAGAKAFTPAGREEWEELYSAKLQGCKQEELWRGIIELELRRLEELAKHLEAVEQKLAQIAAADERVQRVKEVPAVGLRTAELLVALLDAPRRFARGKQVGNYAGFTPKKFQSGTMDCDGRISRGGCGLLRALLVQASWIGVYHKVPWMHELYQRVRRGSDKRKKQAIVAVARHLLVRIWAMLRDGTSWQEPAVTA